VWNTIFSYGSKKMYTFEEKKIKYKPRRISFYGLFMFWTKGKVWFVVLAISAVSLQFPTVDWRPDKTTLTLGLWTADVTANQLINNQGVTRKTFYSVEWSTKVLLYFPCDSKICQWKWWNFLFVEECVQNIIYRGV
jgi:hypothetical protein